MDIKRKYIQLFLDLNKSEKGLLGFTLSNRYNLSTTDVISFMIEYQKKGYITCDNEYRIRITADGIAAIATLHERGITSEYYKGSDYFDEVSSKNSSKQSLRAVLHTLIKMYTFAPNFKFGTK